MGMFDNYSLGKLRKRFNQYLMSNDFKKMCKEYFLSLMRK